MANMNKPGEELIEQGMLDLAQGRETIPAFLVSIGAPRLRRLGIPVPSPAFSMPERRLYDMLRTANPDGSHSQYNALIRRLVSFERASECAKSRTPLLFPGCSSDCRTE